MSKSYMPRCRTCGPLGPPMTLTRAFDAIDEHHDEHPAHKTGYVPVKQSIQVKGTQYDCE